MQTMGNIGRLTQGVTLQKKWELKQGTLIVHTRCNNANNG
ncbi:hypothetical protein KSS87_001971 [Heliosperma pusillum]|nr:hypothetical protein KSS87_001971 [Heliosperma pusillum]